MYYIQHRVDTLSDDKEQLKNIYSWFKENLDAPPWFKNPEGRSHEYSSISWFKDTAKEHILKIHEMSLILEKYDIFIERVTSKSPGRIVFEDKYQVSAVPNNRKIVV